MQLMGKLPQRVQMVRTQLRATRTGKMPQPQLPRSPAPHS